MAPIKGEFMAPFSPVEIGYLWGHPWGGSGNLCGVLEMVGWALRLYVLREQFQEGFRPSVETFQPSIYVTTNTSLCLHYASNLDGRSKTFHLREQFQDYFDGRHCLSEYVTTTKEFPISSTNPEFRLI